MQETRYYKIKLLFAACFFLLFGLGSLYIFITYLYDFLIGFYHLETVVTMYKTMYSFFGAFIFGITGFIAACIFKLLKLAKEEDYSKSLVITLVSSIAIMFLLPQAIHFSTSSLLKNKGYSFCQEMSHTSFKFSKRVYVRDAALCIEDDQRL